jgi:hypothetical protein
MRDAIALCFQTRLASRWRTRESWRGTQIPQRLILIGLPVDLGAISRKHEEIPRPDSLLSECSLHLGIRPNFAINDAAERVNTTA